VVSPHPDPDAWQELRARVDEEHGVRADFYLTEVLGQALARVEPGRRDAVLDGLAGLLAARGDSLLVATLASDGEPAARHLGLAAVGRLPPPFDPVLIQPVRGLLMDRRLPEEAQLAAAATVLRAYGGDGPLVTELLQKLVSGLAKARSIERLRRLEQRTGKAPAIDALCARLEDRLRMSCPRCSAELRRPEMIRHLWEEHRLLLEGRRVREPWGLIEEWVDAFRGRPDPELLDRCRLLGQQLDPEHGLLRVERLILARGVADADARRRLLEDAAEQHAARCPWCYTLVPVPREMPPFYINERPGRLSSRGYSVEVSERGLRSFLEVSLPDRVLYRGPEPGRRLTPQGATLLLAGPCVVLALAFAVGGLFGNPPPLGAVVLLLLGAALLALVARVFWELQAPLAGRIRGYAWMLLVPRLHAGEFVLDDSAFLAGLARQCADPRDAPLRAPLFPALLKRMENAVKGGTGPPGHLAILYRLVIEDAAVVGEDPVPLVVEQLARCFVGRLPMVFAERLLEDWRCDWWTRGNLARLRVLLCDRAFEAGFEVRNLLDAGQSAPALGAVLECDDPDGLAALRLLWSLRPSRPWDRCGEAVTAFELAADPGREGQLGRYPNLLLWQGAPEWLIEAEGGKGELEAAEILLCAEGVRLQGFLFVAPPRVVEVNTKPVGSELVMEPYTFRSPGGMDGLAQRMERWFRYAFHEFLPAVESVLNWRSPDRAAILRAWGAVPCPDCRRYLLPRVGEVALALDEAAPSWARR
jgi:hypothetical protein